MDEPRRHTEQPRDPAELPAMQEERHDVPHGERHPAPLDIPFPKGRRRTARRALIFVLLLLAGYLIYTVAYVYLSPDRAMQQIYLVPRDAAVIISSSEPVADWRRFSGSAPWQTLRASKMFAEIAARADRLDSLVNDNKTLLSLVGRRDLLISVHKTRTDDWDFLMLVDLQKVSKLNTLKETVLSIAGGPVTQRRYNGFQITEMHDEATRDILYMAFVENHLVASYTSRLVEAAIDERSSPGIGLDDAFIRADRLVGDDGLCRVFVNYAFLPGLLELYIDRSEYLAGFCGAMDFAGLRFDVASDRLEVDGWTLMREDAPPFMQALLGSGRRRMQAHDIMPARTALYVNIGFENPGAFIGELEAAFAREDKAAYDAMMSAKKLVEKYFEISIDKNLLGWMAGEFAFAQSEPGLLGQDPELIFAIRATSGSEARENMEFLRKRMSYRSPVKFRMVDYQGYDINYVEVKSLFKMLFPSLTQSFDGIYYTFVEDYFVFSNRSASLLSMVEDYRQKNLLAEDYGFRKAYALADDNSTVFAYSDMRKLFPQLRGFLTPGAWNDLQPDRGAIYSFPHWMLQIAGGGRESSLRLAADFEPYAPELGEDATEEDTDDEQELMNELRRFHVEKFEGNVLREFYPGGALRSESETRRGMRNGRHREYYENGSLRVRGRYSDNQPRGTWKYYTEDGRFERKEKHR